MPLCTRIIRTTFWYVLALTIPGISYAYPIPSDRYPSSDCPSWDRLTGEQKNGEMRKFDNNPEKLHTLLGPLVLAGAEKGIAEIKKMYADILEPLMNTLRTYDEGLSSQLTARQAAHAYSRERAYAIKEIVDDLDGAKYAFDWYSDKRSCAKYYGNVLSDYVAKYQDFLNTLPHHLVDPLQANTPLTIKTALKERIDALQSSFKDIAKLPQKTIADLEKFDKNIAYYQKATIKWLELLLQKYLKVTQSLTPAYESKTQKDPLSLAPAQASIAAANAAHQTEGIQPTIISG